MTEFPSFQVFALPDVPLVQAGDDIPQLILTALKGAGFELQAGDILVIASKIISKSQGCIVTLADVEPGQEALDYAEKTDKDPRLVELILQESRMISRFRKGVIVTEHRLGFVSANSAIDQSNVDETQEKVLLLPSDPDQSARDIRQALKQATGHEIAIVISDTHGRPFRSGNIGVAIGVAGMQAIHDQRGGHDLFGRELMATIMGYGDLIASTAHLVMGEGAEGRPIVLIRGLDYPKGDGRGSDMNRPAELDLYR